MTCGAWFSQVPDVILIWGQCRGIAILGTIVAHVATVAPAAGAAAHTAAATNGVAAAYWTGAAITGLMALTAFAFVRRRRG